MTVTRSPLRAGNRTEAVPRRLSVVHLLHTVAYGGIETLVINWLRHLDQQQFQATLVVFGNPGAGGSERPFVDAAERAGLTVRKIDWGRLKPVRRSARQLRAVLGEVHADVLHTHNTYANVVGWYATRHTPIKTLASLYVWSDFGWKRNILQRIDAWVLRRFDLLAAQCEQTRHDTVNRGLPPDKTTVVISGLEPDPIHLTESQRRDKRRELGIGHREIILVNVARLYPEKAHDCLLRCFRDIVNHRPHARLWIVGTGPLLEEVEALRRELNLIDTVRMCGFLHDLHAHLRCLDIQVHPSHGEGVPLAVCAGMASGLPLIASNVGGLREVIDHGVTGILVAPAGDNAFRNQFVDAALRLIDDADERRRLGKAARHFIENDYSVNAATRQLENTYRNLVSTCASASSS
jgi:glycosyltransferase involved in cell wall biosynthesis